MDVTLSNNQIVGRYIRHGHLCVCVGFQIGVLVVQLVLVLVVQLVLVLVLVVQLVDFYQTPLPPCLTINSDYADC